MSSRPATDDAEFVQSLARGLAVIEAFGKERRSLSLTEAAASAGISRASARRLLHTLVRLGYAAFDGKRFDLRPRILNLGTAYFSAASTWEIAQPFLEELVRETRESCSASVLDGTEIVHVARFPAARRIMSIAVKVGDRFPAHASAMGRVLLAELPAESVDRYFASARLETLTERTVTDPRALRRILEKTRKQGFAEIDGELEAGLRSIAVPLRDGGGRMLGSIALSLLSAPNGDSKATAVLLQPMLECAGRIRSALQRVPGPAR